MVIYGVALLAGCMLVGAFIGELIGKLIGIDANVGGVGISMLLLILVAAKGKASGRLRPISQTGITFWSAIYIPVVVAMAASQNVVAAGKGWDSCRAGRSPGRCRQLCPGTVAQSHRR